MVRLDRSSIFVVDDDDDLRETMQSLLDDAGYQVFLAADGASALQRLHEAREQCVVVLDLHMPGVDGVQVLRSVEAEERLAGRHAFILLTADTGPLNPDVHNLLRRRRTPVMHKPFDIELLLDMVTEAEELLA